MELRVELVRLLADGEPRAGVALATALGVDPADVIAGLNGLEELGLVVETIPQRGYRLAEPLELLDRAQIEAALETDARARLAGLELLQVTESTNSRLLAADAPPAGCWHACLAEFQSAGRGRRGRGWIAPFASGLCLSFSWTFATAPGGFAALGLAAGVATLRALARQGVGGVALKWPNDVLHGAGKLGGVLCELRGEATGAARVVVGIGLNVRLPVTAAAAIASRGGLAATDLARAAGPDGPPRRSELAAALLGELVRMVQTFESDGLEPFVAEWNAADALRDRAVSVSGDSFAREGVARGIDSDGALRLEAGGRIVRLLSGEVTLRAVA